MEKDKVKCEKESVKVKESKTCELFDWLEEWDHKVTDSAKEIRIK